MKTGLTQNVEHTLKSFYYAVLYKAQVIPTKEVFGGSL